MPGGVAAVDLGIYCAHTYCAYGASDVEPVAAFAVRSSTVTLEEHTPPTVPTPVVAPLSASGWVGAVEATSATVGLAGSDTLGIRRLELTRTEFDQTEVVASVANPRCVDWSVTPCAEATAGGTEHHATSVTVASLGLDDGVHSIRTKAVDAAGNVSVSTPVELQIDRTPPVPWLAIGGAADAADRVIAWEASRDGSPLVAGRLLLCAPSAPVPAGCEQHQLQGTGSQLRAGSAGIALGPIGSTIDAYVELTDAAGNTGLSAPATIRREAPVVVPDPGTGPRPGDDQPRPTTPPATKPKPKASPRLRVDFRKRMTRSPFLVRGSVIPKSAKRITVTVTGRTTRGKSTRYRVTRKPLKTGRFSVRAKIPRGHNPRRKLKVTITVTPTSGYRATTYKRTLK